MAVVASEDQRFFEHKGFDMEEIRKATQRKHYSPPSQRRQHHHTTNGKKRIPVAGPLLGAKRTGSVLRLPDGTFLEQRTNNGSYT